MTDQTSQQLRNWFNDRSMNKQKAPIKIQLLISTSRSQQLVEIYSQRHRFAVCPFRTQLCAHCAGPHHTDHHRVLGACCKAQPKANPPCAATPGGTACPHAPRCVNCGLDHMSNDTKCSFWKHRFDAKWVQKKYTAMKVGDELMQFMPLPNTPFLNVVGARLPRRLSGPQSFQQEVD
jgi:hypothetical protein